MFGSKDKKISRLEQTIAKMDRRSREITEAMGKENFEEELRMRGLEREDAEAELIQMSNRIIEIKKQVSHLRSHKFREREGLWFTSDGLGKL